MARSEKQKEKLFRILEVLMRETDDENGLTINEIISRLEEYGISAERKSLYDDFKVLEDLGYPVLKLSTKPPRYTLEERVFELAEIKMLVDAVQVSKFITAKKSRQLIEKLGMFAGARRARELSRQVYVEDRVKTINQASIYTIDTIHAAINEGKRLSFLCFDYNRKKIKKYYKNGERYEVSPLALLWSEENYYLVAYEEKSEKIKNFRVDKFEDARIIDEPKSDNNLTRGFNPADYSNKIFGMFGGTEELVTMEFRWDLAGVIIDRFGMEPTFYETDFGFKLSARVMVSPTFFAWILAFGPNARILGPSHVREQLIKRLDDTKSFYDKENSVE